MMYQLLVKKLIKTNRQYMPRKQSHVLWSDSVLAS
jgi:hypothetical protein